MYSLLMLFGLNLYKLDTKTHKKYTPHTHTHKHTRMYKQRQSEMQTGNRRHAHTHAASFNNILKQAVEIAYWEVA